MERRKFLVAGGSLVTAAVLGGAENALAHDEHAHEDPDPGLVIATVETRESSRTIGVRRLDNGAPLKVATTLRTVIPAPGGTNRDLSRVTMGETVIVVAPGAASAAPGSTVTADRVVHCNFGVWADAKRIRARE